MSIESRIVVVFPTEEINIFSLSENEHRRGSHRRMRHSFLFFFAAALTAQGQSQIVSFGVKGGIPLTEAVSSRYQSFGSVNTGRWTVGPTVELHLPWNFSIEFDALYRTYRSTNQYIFSYGSEYSPILYMSRQDVGAWDFPLLLKYRFSFLGEKVRPFLTAGKLWTRESIDSVANQTCMGSSSSCIPPDSFRLINYYSNHSKEVRDGWTGGGGVEFKYKRIAFSPELRYARITRQRTNQVTLLFGLTF